MAETYTLHVAGLTRELPICKVNDHMDIAAFIMFSDVELTVACAAELLKKCPEFDVILTAEAKGIPLAYEMARQSGKQWIPARKGPKLYMQDPVVIEDESITTAGKQVLVIDRKDIDYMNGKRILIVDDVISTGGSLHALETLAAKSTGTIVGCCAALAEGDAAKRTDITFLAPLPLFFH
ncbi:phosphoribosyltransferase family protein [uncultured Gemmiger sp.]|uniref:phosphoribosyltransferase family protein n=1 Tax=uncultured Gemmiger sp. TaxID=1623490 RepID=UPI0025E73C00|nr:phosphoribosyltransferase family protein [uncultured Gemmiger sp.]